MQGSTRLPIESTEAAALVGVEAAEITDNMKGMFSIMQKSGADNGKRCQSCKTNGSKKLSDGANKGKRVSIVQIRHLRRLRSR